jgi:aspartate/methionine/tyrosine aminotransferase
VSSPPFAEYVREHFVRSRDPFDPARNPDGYIPLCLAENKLVSDLLLPKMAGCRDVPAAVLGYDCMVGTQAFRVQLARFMSRAFLGRAVSPEQVAVLAGVGSALEALFHVIADPGDGVLVPTPSYAGFWADLEVRNQLKVIPVSTSSRQSFQITTGLLDAAVAGAEAPLKAVLFTSPDNPMGRVYSPAEITAVIEWAEDRGVHLVVDEIYALSVFGDLEFSSCASLRSVLGDAIHIVWGFSKDFAASGLRCGVLITENESVMQGVEALAYWACCSGDTQHLLLKMISDEVWVDMYIREMRRRLGTAHRRVTQALEEEEIPYFPSTAGFFLLCDLRQFLSEPTWEAEYLLWTRILHQANVNLTPGQSCRISEPGFMRLCFAGVPTDVAVHGVHAVGRVLGSISRS